ncbi:Phosphopantetheine adenylyltransferase [compost metagenome]
MIAFVPGSFDPITWGHFDIIKRCSNLYDEVVVAVLNNSKKDYTFSVDERFHLISEVIKDEKIRNVRVVTFDGLLTNLVKEYCDGRVTPILVKGLRTVGDYEYELQMAHLNRDLKVETSFMITSPEYSYISSSMVKEVAKLDGDFERYVPTNVAKALYHKLNL